MTRENRTALMAGAAAAAAAVLAAVCVPVTAAQAQTELLQTGGFTGWTTSVQQSAQTRAAKTARLH